VREHDRTRDGTRISDRFRQKPDRCDQQRLASSMLFVSVMPVRAERSRSACLLTMRSSPALERSRSRLPGIFLLSARPGVIKSVLQTRDRELFAVSATATRRADLSDWSG
jgi:hypothetical protein